MSFTIQKRYMDYVSLGWAHKYHITDPSVTCYYSAITRFFENRYGIRTTDFGFGLCFRSASPFNTENCRVYSKGSYIYSVTRN
jgi:hypothetical protein